MQDFQENQPIPEGWEATEESPLKRRCQRLVEEMEDLGCDITPPYGEGFQIRGPADGPHSQALIDGLIEYLSGELESDQLDEIKRKIAITKEKRRQILTLIDEPRERNLILEKEPERWLLGYGISRQHMRKVRTNLDAYRAFGQIGRRIIAKMPPQG
jgi:hypothetical protein